MTDHRNRIERKPPIHIPLTFDAAVGGLLKVDPKEPVESVRKKPAKKGKKNRNNQAKG